MQTTNRLLDDLAKVANGAVSAVSGLKGDVEAMVRRQIDKLVRDRHLVPREEFDAVKAMAAKARAENEALAKRVATLEAQLAKPAKPKKPAAKKTAAPKKAAAKTA